MTSYDPNLPCMGDPAILVPGMYQDFERLLAKEGIKEKQVEQCYKEAQELSSKEVGRKATKETRRGLRALQAIEAREAQADNPQPATPAITVLPTKKARRWSPKNATTHRSTHRPVGDDNFDRRKKRSQRHQHRDQIGKIIVKTERKLVPTLAF